MSSHVYNEICAHLLETLQHVGTDDMWTSS